MRLLNNNSNRKSYIDFSVKDLVHRSLSVFFLLSAFSLLRERLKAVPFKKEDQLLMVRLRSPSILSLVEGLTSFVSLLKQRSIIITISFFLIPTFSIVSFAQESVSSVEIRGDQIEYIIEENKMIAEGNVVVSKGDVKLTCDKMTLYRDTNIVHAEGNVVLRYKRSTIYGDELTYNFNKMTGDFMGGRILADPYYGTGEKIRKIGENHIVIEKGQFTTCDLDKPHFHFASKKVDLYPGDKAVAKNVRMVVGKLPILYIPKYVKDLKDQRQRVILTPGYDKEWGMYLLQAWRYYFSEDFKGTIHLDARERKDFAWGIDLDYRLKNKGKGLIRTYYMNERSITSKRFWQERPSPTIEKERFKVEWRHQWIIDKKTEALWQYYRSSDSAILKDYFEQEYEKDSNPRTFFQFTRMLPAGVLSFRTDARVNRFVSAVERLPELKYTMGSKRIGNTNFYIGNTTSFSNLTNKNAAPSEARTKTMRLYTDNSINYPFKIAFIEINPYVAGYQTYYSRIKEINTHNIISGQFRTGASLSTKFFRFFDFPSNLWGININRLRHIVTPSISYGYKTRPTIPSSKLNYFDAVDSASREHSVTLSLENKIQTKRKGEGIVDLVRFVGSTDFRLKEHEGKGGFDHVKADLEIRPTESVSFFWDANYNTRRDQLLSSNIDLYIKDGERWSLDFAKRWTRDADDQITAEFQHILNPKWKYKMYYRFDIDTGLVKEQEYTVTRDLHCWEVDVTFNETRGEGSEIWMVFRMKAFPEMGFDFSKSFNKRKLGSQSR